MSILKRDSPWQITKVDTKVCPSARGFKNKRQITTPPVAPPARDALSGQIQRHLPRPLTSDPHRRKSIEMQCVAPSNRVKINCVVGVLSLMPHVCPFHSFRLLFIPLGITPTGYLWAKEPDARVKETKLNLLTQPPHVLCWHSLIHVPYKGRSNGVG